MELFSKFENSRNPLHFRRVWTFEAWNSKVRNPNFFKIPTKDSRNSSNHLRQICQISNKFCQISNELSRREERTGSGLVNRRSRDRVAWHTYSCTRERETRRWHARKLPQSVDRPIDFWSRQSSSRLFRSFLQSFEATTVGWKLFVREGGKGHEGKRWDTDALKYRRGERIDEEQRGRRQRRKGNDDSQGRRRQESKLSGYSSNI